MATRIAMEHKQTGLLKDGFYGFSWTTFYFGLFPALFRLDFASLIGGFVVYAIIGFFTIGLGDFLISILNLGDSYDRRETLEDWYYLIKSIYALGIGVFLTSFIWAFKYNYFYTRKLIERGYTFIGTHEENEKASASLGVSIYED